MKLRNILGVSALTLLLGVSMSGVSANAAGGNNASPVSDNSAGNNKNDKTSYAGGPFKEGNLSMSDVDQMKFNPIDISGGDTPAARTTSTNNIINANLNNNTGSDSINWSLSVNGSELKTDKGTAISSSYLTINGSKVTLGDKGFTNILDNKNGLSEGNGQKVTLNKPTIQVNGNMPQNEGKNLNLNTTLDWSLSSGTPSANGQK